MTPGANGSFRFDGTNIIGRSSGSLFEIGVAQVPVSSSQSIDYAVSASMSAYIYVYGYEDNL